MKSFGTGSSNGALSRAKAVGVVAEEKWKRVEEGGGEEGEEEKRGLS